MFHQSADPTRAERREVGEAVASGNVPREELIITTKAWRTQLGYDNVLRAYEQSLKKLKMDYADIYLLHWPARDYKVDRDSWRAMERLYDEGLVKAVGVSNYITHHLENLLTVCNVPPMLDQIEFHPGYMQTGTVDYCQRHSIVVEAWSPLGRGALLNHPVVEEIAKKHKVSTAKILLGFCLAHNVLPLVKSSSKERLKDNLSLFDFKLSEDDLYVLRGIAEKTGWSGQHPDLSIPKAKVGDF